jgi:hypothetical protein
MLNDCFYHQRAKVTNARNFKEWHQDIIKFKLFMVNYINIKILNLRFTDPAGI